MKAFTLLKVIRRVRQLLISLFALLVVTFVICRVLPNDPVGAVVGELADPAAFEAMRQSSAWICPFITRSGSISPLCCMAIWAPPR